MASNLATFRTLLSSYADSGKPIPNVILKEDNDLGQAFARIVTKEQVNQGETAGQVTSRYIDELCSELSSEQNAEAVSKFGEVIELISTKVKNSWDSVESIRDTGRELAVEMDKIVNAQLAQNEFVSKHINYSALNTDFPIFDWAGTNAMGSINNVIKSVNSLMTNEGEPSDQINDNLYNIIISDMTKYGHIEEVSLTEETRKSAIDAVMTVCQNSPIGNVEIVIDIITGISKIDQVHDRLAKLKDPGQMQGLMFDTVKLFDDTILSMFPILEAIVTEQVVPVPTSKETVIANAKNIITELELAAYYEYMVRTTTYRDSLLLQGGMINVDKLEDFKSLGGTTKMLAEFIRFMYNDNASMIPVTGINGKSIVDGSATISDRVRKDIANIESRVAIAKNDARTSAYRIVMRDYISKKVKRDNPDLQGSIASSRIEDYMKTCVVPIVDDIRQYNVNFIDAAMNGMVAVEYPNSFTAHLFKELGAAYISATEANGNITSEDLRQVDVTVITKLIVSFLTDSLVQQIPEGATGPVANV